MNKTAPPTLTFLPAEGLCNTVRSTCKQVAVYGDSFINSPELKCFAEPVTVSVSKSWCQSYTVKGGIFAWYVHDYINGRKNKTITKCCSKYLEL